MKNKVELCIETLNTFLKSYAEYQDYYTQDNKNYPWVFPDERAFNSFKKFSERLNKVYEIFKASLLYSSIQEYKLVGVAHAPFKFRLNELSELFKEHYQVFVESTYNPLDLKSGEFLEDYDLFSTKVSELDCKLGTTLFQACLSCATSEDSYKFMKMVQNLLERSQVNLEFKKQVTSLEGNIYLEILAAKESYDNTLAAFESDSQVVYKNLTNMAAKVQWSIDLQRKLSFPMDFLQHLQEYYNKDDNAEILKADKEIQKLLRKFQGDIFNTWETALSAVKEELDQPLFRDDEQNLILNFAPRVIDISREITYINLITSDLLPSDALQLSDSLASALVAQFLLACTVRWYNYLNENLMDFEIMLIKDDWEKMCQDLKTGLEEKWTKDDLKEYAENLYKIGKLLYEKIKQSRRNLREVQEFIETWNKTPVFMRETPDSTVNFELTTMTPKMSQQLDDVNKTSTDMYRVMEENMQLFGCNPEMDKWKNYVLYLDLIIETGLKDSIQCSLQYLAENTNRFNKKLAPFYKIRMMLEEDIAFIPSLDRERSENFFTSFDAIIERIYSPASEIRRLADPEMDYSEAIVEDSDLNSLKDQMIQHIESGINNILAHSTTYQIYSDIWLQDIDAVLEDFILYGPLRETKSDEEEEIQAAAVPLEMKSPSEEEFKAEITKFHMLQKKIEEIPDEILIESWLILETISFKESLLSLIRNWSSSYKKKLMELKSQDKLRKDEYDGD